MLNDVKALKRSAIDSAFDEFRKGGSLSMRQLAVSLGVSAPALYHHFAGRQDILDSVAERAFAVFERQIRATGETDPRRIISTVLDSYRSFAMEEPHLFGLIFVERRAAARKFPRDFARHRSAVFNLLWKAVEDCLGGDADGASDDALHIAHDLWALAHGHILLWRASRFEDDATFVRVFGRSVERFMSSLD